MSDFVDTIDSPSSLVGEPPGPSDALAPVTANLVKDCWEKGQKAIRPELRQADVNRSFVNGEQWLKWSPTLARVDYDLPDDEERQRATLNRLRPTLRRLVAKLGRRPLVFDVRAKNPDGASTVGAKTCQAVISAQAEAHDWEDMRLRMMWNHFTDGTTVLAVDWDPGAGDHLGYDAESGNKVGTGDTCEALLTLAEVAFEPGTRDAETSRWWVKGQALPPDAVREHYGLPDRPSPDASARGTALVRMIRNETGGEDHDLTLVLTYYERPNRLRPQGAVATVVGEKIVGQIMPWPFPFTDRLNCVVHVETPGIGWTGQTVLSDAIGPQTAVNHGWSNLLEHAKLAANARFMAPRGTMDPDDFRDDPSYFVEYDPTPNGRQPGWESPAALPSWILQLPADAAKQIDDVLGDFPVARGAPAGSITSGSGLALLAEQGDSPLTLLSRTLAQAWGRFASLVAQTLEAKVANPRDAIVRIAGSNDPEVTKWTGESFAGQTDVTVPLEAVAPRSATAGYELAIELHREFPDFGFREFQTIADLPGLGFLIDALDPQLQQARRENHAIMTNADPLPLVMPWDNHMTHIHEHEAERASLRYEQADDQTKNDLNVHIQGHQTEAQLQAAQQIASAAVHPALAGAAKAGEPPSLEKLMAGTPGAVPAMGGVGPQAQQPAVEPGRNPEPPPGLTPPQPEPVRP